MTCIMLLLSACGPSIPKSELHDLQPLIEVVELNTSPASIRLRVTHRNKLTRTNNRLSCQLAIKDLEPIQFADTQLPDLTRYARETVDIALSELPTTAFNQDPMPYVLDCYLYAENFRDERVVKKSTLYPIPGTTGRFR